MTDINIVWDAVNNRGDWAIAASDLATGNDLVSAVLLSLFTDRVLPDDVVPPDHSGDRRGWWGDSFEPSPIGSRLWILMRAKKADSVPVPTLKLAKDICIEALQWLLDDGVAATVDVQTRWLTDIQLGIQITITEPLGKVTRLGVTAAAGRFSWAWQNIPS